MVLIHPPPPPLIPVQNLESAAWGGTGPSTVNCQHTHQHELLVGGLAGNHVEPERRSERARFVGVLADHFHRRFGHLANDS